MHTMRRGERPMSSRLASMNHLEKFRRTVGQARSGPEHQIAVDAVYATVAHRRQIGPPLPIADRIGALAFVQWGVGPRRALPGGAGGCPPPSVAPRARDG